jgi:uncharacterized protein (TIGR03437 family)
MGYSGLTKMYGFRPGLSLFFWVLPSVAATFGTLVSAPTSVGPLGDMVLDELHTPRRIYAVAPTSNKLVIYNIAANGGASLFSNGIDTDPLPVSVALSGNFLYVACYNASVIDVFDLTKSVPAKVNTISLGSSPEAVAAGGDGRILISTIGGGGRSILSIYDPNASAANALQGLATPAGFSAPAAITEPLPSDAYLAGHARFAITGDGMKIIGAHTTLASRSVFVYDVRSATVLAARTFGGFSGVLAVSPDGSRIVSGNLLLDGKTLAVLATQSTLNAPYVITGTFTQIAPITTAIPIVQGGAAFSPDGAHLYAAYNIVPLQNPAAKSTLGQLTVNSPDNLLIQLGIQIPENFFGKIAISAKGDNLYALSKSGFTWLPIGALQSSFPLGVPDSNTALLASDQCGVTASLNSAVIPVRNAGAGRMTLSAPQTVTASATSTQLSASPKPYGADVTARFNAAAARTLGTATPDLLLLQSLEAVNIINAVRVYQNNRNAEAPGAIYPVDTGATGAGTSGISDIVLDSQRHRLYLANFALNRIEIFDTQAQKFGPPISVGQQPKAMALSTDTNTLYVANNGSEYVSIIDLNKGAVTGAAFLPPVQFNSGSAPIFPAAIAASLHGVQVLTSNGALYDLVANNLVNRVLNPAIFGTATSVAGPNQQMIATPDGSQILLLGGNGVAYIYDASADDYISESAVVTVGGGFGFGVPGSYFGPLGAGPNSSYFLIDDQVLNAQLSLISGGSSGTGVIGIGGLPSPGGPSATRPVAAVSAVNSNTYIRFSTPVRASTTTAVTDAGLVELVQIDQTAGTVKTIASINTLEGPLTQVTGTSRVLVNSRMMAYDAAGGMVYILTASGLSAIPLSANAPANAAPQFSSAGVVNTANFQRGIAPTGLVSIFGRNLAASATAGTVPLAPVLGGACVTLNNLPLPLLATSAGQINAQIPPGMAAGTYPLVVRSIANQLASTSVNVSVSKYAPAVFVDTNGPAIFHHDGTRVNKDRPASRDEPLTIYATGLGVTTGGRVTSGNYSPSSPLAVTGPVQLYFGDPTISDAAVIVDWSGLMPGSIGVYQINARIPGTHLKGDALPVTIRVGNVSSSTTGQNVPVVYVN